MTNKLDILFNILSEKTGACKDELSIDTQLDTIIADSLELMEVIMEIEDEFDISIPNEDIVPFETIGDLSNYIEKL